MPCSKDEIITILNPVLDTLRLSAMASLTTLRALNLGFSVPVTVSVDSVRAVAEIGRGLGDGGFAAKARAQAKNIVAAIPAALPVSPTTQLLLESQLDNIESGDLISSLAYGLANTQLAYIEKQVAEEFGVSLGTIGSAVNSIRSVLSGGDITARAYLSVIINGGLKHARTLDSQLYEIQQNLYGIESVLLDLYTGARLDDIMKDSRRALRLLRRSDTLTDRVIQNLEDRGSFDDRTFLQVISSANGARDELLPDPTGQPLRALSGRVQSTVGLAQNISVATKGIATLSRLGIEGSRSASFLNTLAISILNFDDEWSVAIKKTARNPKALRKYQTMIRSISEDIANSLKDDSPGGDALPISKQGKWNLAISLALGDLMQTFSASQRSGLRSQTAFTESRDVYENVSSLIESAGLIEFTPIPTYIQAIAKKAPGVFAGANRQPDQAIGKAAVLRADLLGARRYVQDQRRILSRINRAMRGFPVSEHNTVTQALGILTTLRMGGWKTLFTMGRLGRLSEFSYGTVTAAGLATFCLGEYLPGAGPGLKNSVNRLLTRVRGINEVEEKLVFQIQDLSESQEREIDTKIQDAKSFGSDIQNLQDQLLV